MSSALCVEWTSQPDLPFETSCSFSRCPFRRPPPLGDANLPGGIGGILTNGERPLSRVENLLFMLDWAVAGCLIPLYSRGFAVLESFSKRAFGSILC